MRVYKEKQFLVFDSGNGRTCKYDFAKKQAIGWSGKPVNDLRKQLQGMTMNQLIDCCEDKQYAKFLRYVLRMNCSCTNIGTVLSKVPYYSNYEQIFSAGFEDIIDNYHFRYNISDIPKALIKVAKKHNIQISNDLVELWRTNPNAYNIAYNLEYVSLNNSNIQTILTRKMSKWDAGTGKWLTGSYYNALIDMGYNAKSLLLYLDSLKTYEAIDDMYYVINDLYDYAKMMSEISNKFEKYPRNFLTTHKIACRNYNRMKQKFSEYRFKQRICKDYEYQYKDYVFLYPDSTQDIKDEAASQNNCVASYIDNVINGGCDILFLRKKDSPKDSLVTIEVRNNKIVQARRRFNEPVREEDQEAIDAWNNKFKDYEKEKVAA